MSAQKCTVKLWGILACLWLIACPAPESDLNPRKCNLFENLCDKTVPEIAFATTHNAMSNKAEGWAAYNHFYGIEDQLNEGFRGFMLDIYEEDGTLKLCHGTCLGGSIDFETVMDLYNDFLEQHPHEVIVFIFETHIAPERFGDALDNHPLGLLAFEMSPSEPWPTLNELIDSNQRLIMFSDDVNNAPPYILEMWAHAVDVHYKAETQADFSCDWFRGEPDNALFYFQSLYFGPPPQ